MKNIKGFALGLTVGLALAISSLAFAQETKTTHDKASCCTESCSMQHAKGQQDANKHSAEGCCCCSDSCDMHMKDKQKEKAE
jgi:hypothetical protein